LFFEPQKRVALNRIYSVISQKEKLLNKRVLLEVSHCVTLKCEEGIEIEVIWKYGRV
jgi:hypothetical protein